MMDLAVTVFILAASLLIATSALAEPVNSVTSSLDLSKPILAIDKCRQDDCYQAWIVAVEDVGDVFDVHLSSGKTVKFRDGWERESSFDPESNVVEVVSCDRARPYVIRPTGERIDIEEEGEDGVHATEDESVIWRAACGLPYDVLR